MASAILYIVAIRMEASIAVRAAQVVAVRDFFQRSIRIDLNNRSRYPDGQRESSKIST